jgi:hypothetical protein
MSKTGKQIVEEVNELAGVLLGKINRGMTAPDGHKFWEAQDIRSKDAWESAVEIYEKITASEVHDALIEVEDETRERFAAEKKKRWTLEYQQENTPPGEDAALVLAEIRAFARKQSDLMDDPKLDDSGDDARPPEGDDWNELYAKIAPAE